MSSYKSKSSQVSVTKYADDITLVIPVCRSDSSDLVTLTSEVDHFTRWCHNNCMQINAKKTKVMNVCFSSTPLSPVPSFDNVLSLKILSFHAMDRVIQSKRSCKFHSLVYPARHPNFEQPPLRAGSLSCR